MNRPFSLPEPQFPHLWRGGVTRHALLAPPGNAVSVGRLGSRGGDLPRNGGVPGIASAPGPTRTRKTEVRAAKPKRPPGTASLHREQYQLGEGGNVRGSCPIISGNQGWRKQPLGQTVRSPTLDPGRGRGWLGARRYGAREGPDLTARSTPAASNLGEAGPRVAVGFPAPPGGSWYHWSLVSQRLSGVLSRSVVSDSLQPRGVCSPPASSVHGILQARTLEWVVKPSSRGSSQLRNPTQVSLLQADSLPSEPPRKPSPEVRYILINDSKES